LNNNRGNNRRRGRGNNRQQNSQQLNRIDSRARGNAPQLLEKYKKLAHDAHLNGDRVQEEYYLQFADHYFRVMADQRQRQEESRQNQNNNQGQGRRDDRQNDYSNDDDSDDNDGYDDRASASSQNSRSREDSRNREDLRNRDEQHSDRQSEASDENGEDDSDGDGDRSVYEPAENPFVRGDRAPRSAAPKAPRKPRRRKDADDGDAAEKPAARRTKAQASGDDESKGKSIDAAALPPAIGSNDDDGDDKPAPRRRAICPARRPQCILQPPDAYTILPQHGADKRYSPRPEQDL